MTIRNLKLLSLWNKKKEKENIDQFGQSFPDALSRSNMECFWQKYVEKGLLFLVFCLMTHLDGTFS